MDNQFHSTMAKANSDNKSICMGLLAHVDAGKTTLSEAILYTTGEIRKLGRVDHGDSYLDTDTMERNRGITVFSKQAAFKTGNTKVTVLDTPGHVDFSAEMERVLLVIDYALLIISASEGVQSHTETLWRLLKDRNIPVIVFVNKMDLAVRDKSVIISELVERFGNGFVDFSLDHKSDEFIDGITLNSAELAEQFLSGKEITNRDIEKAINSREVFPCCFGSALKLEGIEGLLECIDNYTTNNKYSNKKDFGARVFKITHDVNGERLTFMRLTGGHLKAREEIGDEKVNQIRIYSGMKFTNAEEVSAGDICAVTGLKNTMPGDALGRAELPMQTELEPFVVHSISKIIDSNGAVPDNAVVIKNLKQLNEEDPKLHIAWNSESGEITLRMMGEMQLEILQQMIADRFGYKVEFGPARVLYMETISKTIEGAGHFEPLRHYAEVHLILEPGERGSGLVFDSIASEDALSRNWQRLILTHLEEKEHIGTLVGAPITDMKITLAAGRAHDKHTNGGDFREATYRAIRQGLMQARAEGEAVLLEPYTTFDIKLDANLMGRVMTDIKNLSGDISEINQDENSTILKGRIPSKSIMEYLPTFTTVTSGQGRIVLKQSGYEECADAETVIAEMDYDPERDTNNPADSVFVSHTESDIVHWDKAMERMHIKPVLKGENVAETSRELQNSARREAYKRRVATDSELKLIFERTYGKAGNKLRREKETRDFSKKVETPKNIERNLEIKEKHQHSINSAQAEDAPTVVLIDGYNLINADAKMKELANQDIGMARDFLIDRLINYQGFMESEVIVVFDAYKVPGQTVENEQRFGVKIIYSAEDEPADIRLGRIASEYNKKRVIRIVSSDALVQENALVNNALRVSSKEFLAELDATETEIAAILHS